MNTVAPGPVATELFNASNPRRSRALEAAIPVGRSGLPEEVAHVVAMFMDRRAAFVTGQLIHVRRRVGVAGRAARRYRRRNFAAKSESSVAVGWWAGA